jgi:hypothetical protein
MSAPERIWLRWEPGAAVTNGPLTTHPGYSEYIRADLVDAAVKRALEAALRAYMVGVWYRNPDVIDAIRAIAASPDTIAKLARGE